MRTPIVEIEHGHHGAAQQWTFLTFTMKQFSGRFFFYSYVRPLDARGVRRYLFHARDFQHGAAVDEQMVKTTLGFEQEDRPVIENMRPVFSPEDTQSELLLPEDEIMVAYRRRLAEWQQRGWRIDVEALERLGRRRVYSIPSPDRRAHRNWVTAPVPLVA